MMQRLSTRTIVLSVVALLSSSPLTAQTRDVRPRSLGTAVLSGVVMSTDQDPKPVRRVRVVCTGDGFAATAISDDQGRFRFTGLRAGRYTIAGTKEAWLPASYGAKRPLREGSAIPLADGQSTAIVFSMSRGGVITGVLLDASNQPAPNTMVNALRSVTQGGTRRLVPSGSAVTDDRGVYRIYGLAPGDYFVGASAHVAAFNAPTSELRLVDERSRTERTVAFAATYYPGTPIATQAMPVTVRAAEERDGVDFALQLVPTARVGGTVTTVDGQLAPPGTLVNLVANGQSVLPGAPTSGMRSAQVAADGAFQFADVAPGTYNVIAREGPPLTWASTDLAVDGEPITGVSLALQPAQTLSGRIVFDASRLTPPSDLHSIRLMLQRVQSDAAVSLSPSIGVIDRAGRFTINDVIPGRYRLVASLPGLGAPGAWYLRSAVVRGQDTLDTPIDIRPNENVRDALIVLSDRPGRLTGTVHNAAGGPPNTYTVILFPADPSLWMFQARRIQAVRPSADGAFTFSGLPPGTYHLAAIDDVEPNAWFDPALLQRLLPASMRVTIEEGEQKVQDIRLGSPNSERHFLP